VSFLFKLCCEGKERADPDLLVDMIFDKGGIRINRWGFAQQVQVSRSLALNFSILLASYFM